MASLSYEPGSWLLLSSSRSWALLDIAPEDSRVGELEDAMGTTDPVTAVLDVLVAGGVSRLPDFVVLSYEPRLLRYVARGPVTVTVRGDDPSRLIADQASPTWVDKILPDPAGSIRFSVPDVIALRERPAASDAMFAGELELLLDGNAECNFVGSTSVELESELPVVRPTPQEWPPGSDTYFHLLTSDTMSRDELISRLTSVADPRVVDTAPQAHRFTAGAPARDPDDKADTGKVSSDTAGRGVTSPTQETEGALRRQESAAPRAEQSGVDRGSPTEQYLEPAAPSLLTVNGARHLHRDPELAPSVVWAVHCENDHPSPPYAARCRMCGDRINDQHQIQIMRPSLGHLILSTGARIPLDRDVVLGRAPRSARPEGSLPHLIRLGDSADVSRVHAEVFLEAWHVKLRDLGSTNGTTLRSPGGVVQPVRPFESYVLADGCSASLAGAISFTYVGRS